jgi:hypothetical protein
MGELQHATPWHKPVRDTGKLLVYDEISIGRWATVFTLALASFNKHMAAAGVQVEQAKSKGKANVIMKLTPSTLTHGKALMGIRYPQRDVIMEAEILLPDDPRVGEQRDPASVEQLEVIAVHELIHAAGLSNSDHGGDGIFNSPLTPRDGKFYIPQKGRNQALMPPIRVGMSIISKVKKIW